ncbi:hypothetical protein GCK72_006911 [Caenorhabditis remanei]|uniref:Uncharacterized protein n=1 Tax=Caenorhabditis remanei TaxID=31234 RepID=A0A2P4WG12_CAERE|nr:hypothetical protein GCK72_006911 [Caenorhabditis remanei]KAF1766953.1 hypothetical protein GCK72_006911 [Caenorhabditis remanei]
MRLPIFLLLLFCTTVLCRPRLSGCNHHRRHQRSEWARTVLSNHLHAFEGAIKSGNKALFVRLFKLKDANDTAELQTEMERFKDYRFKIVKAGYYPSNTRIYGYYQLLSKIGFSDNEQQYRVVIEHNAASPTGWIIISIGEVAH